NRLGLSIHAHHTEPEFLARIRERVVEDEDLREDLPAAHGAELVSHPRRLWLRPTGHVPCGRKLQHAVPVDRAVVWAGKQLEGEHFSNREEALRLGPQPRSNEVLARSQ